METPNLSKKLCEANQLACNAKINFCVSVISEVRQESFGILDHLKRLLIGINKEISETLNNSFSDAVRISSFPQ